mgnify:CR=1 FL=1
MQNWEKLGSDISEWILDYANKNDITSLVVGVSGGIDSAVTSILCAKTGLRTIAISMPIHQNEIQNNLSVMHCKWLSSNWSNVENHVVDLSGTFDSISYVLREKVQMTYLWPTPGPD